MTYVKPGDIADGHAFTNDHGWVPIAAGASVPSGARSSYRRFIAPAAVTLGVVGTMLAAAIFNGSETPEDAAPPARPSATATLFETPEPADTPEPI